MQWVCACERASLHMEHRGWCGCWETAGGNEIIMGRRSHVMPPPPPHLLFTGPLSGNPYLPCSPLLSCDILLHLSLFHLLFLSLSPSPTAPPGIKYMCVCVCVCVCVCLCVCVCVCVCVMRAEEHASDLESHVSPI